ncbi:MAG: hypothetical protein ACFFDN_33700 [Candidatus Hodarchaeota archaeon]
MAWEETQFMMYFDELPYNYKISFIFICINLIISAIFSIFTLILNLKFAGNGRFLILRFILIAVILNGAANILSLFGIFFEKDIVINTGFGWGLVAWSFLIICNTYGIFWTQIQRLEWITTDLLCYHISEDLFLLRRYIFLFQIFKPLGPKDLFRGDISTGNARIFIITDIISVILCVIGIFSFYIIKYGSKIKTFKGECSHYYKVYTPMGVYCKHCKKRIG